MCLCSCPHPKMHSWQGSPCWEDFALLFWVSYGWVGVQAICSIRVILKWNTFNKEPMVCDLFWFQAEDSGISLQWFFFPLLGPLYRGHQVPVKPNQLQLRLSDTYRGAAPEFSHVLPSLCGIPLLPFQSTFGACWTVLTDGSCSGQQSSPSLLVFKKYLCLVQRV